MCVSQVKKLLDNGRGEYVPSHGVQHVVVLGGAVRTASEILMSFLREILHTSHEDHTHIVLMSRQPPDESIKAILKAKWAQHRLTYLVGSPVEPADRSRAKVDTAAMAFILGDTFASDLDAEDQCNIFRTLALVNNHPKLPVRLMLHRPENRELAVQSGVKRFDCFSVTLQLHRI